MNEWVLIGAMALVTLTIRYGLMALSGHIHLSASVTQALGFVPPAVLSAIIVPAALIPDGVLDVSLGNSRMIGAIAALAIGLWRQNLLLTIVAGMGVFGLWEWLTM